MMYKNKNAELCTFYVYLVAIFITKLVTRDNSQNSKIYKLQQKYFKKNLLGSFVSIIHKNLWYIIIVRTSLRKKKGKPFKYVHEVLTTNVLSFF